MNININGEVPHEIAIKDGDVTQSSAGSRRCYSLGSAHNQQWRSLAMPLENPDKHINIRLHHLEGEIKIVTGQELYLSVGCYSEDRKRYVLEDRTVDVVKPVSLTSHLTHREIIIALDALIQTLRRTRIHQYRTGAAV